MIRKEPCLLKTRAIMEYNTRGTCKVSYTWYFTLSRNVFHRFNKVLLPDYWWLIGLREILSREFDNGTIVPEIDISEWNFWYYSDKPLLDKSICVISIKKKNFNDIILTVQYRGGIEYFLVSVYFRCCIIKFDIQCNILFKLTIA